MRFPFTIVAFLFTFLLLSPLQGVLRLAAGGSAIQYGTVLGIGYLGLLAIFWGFRQFLVFTEQWDRFGLKNLDEGIVGAWPLRWSMALTALLVGAGVVAMLRTRDPVSVMRLIEYLFAGLAALMATLDAWHGRRVEDPDDPLPKINTPDEAGKDDGKDNKDLSLFWYFRREAGHSLAQSYTAKVTASMSRYVELQGHDHSPTSLDDYARYVRDGRTPEVLSVVRQLREISVKNRFSPICEINNVLAFAQRFRYVSDLEAKGVSEYPKYPLETIVDDAGDCEDHAILAAACLLELGHEVRLVGVTYPGERTGHMALAVAGAENAPKGFALSEPGSGKQFFYCEATADAVSTSAGGVSFRMGEVPDRELNAELQLIPI